MIGSARQRISGWGRASFEECAVYRPEKLTSLREVVKAAPERSLLSRGLGRSYGDAALNGAGAVISHLRLSRFLAFEPEAGILEVEAGASLAEIIDTFLPRGFFLPVTPGTKHVTVGGAIASDVHGKNHHLDGTFGEFVLGFRLQAASGEVLSCTREENPEVFWATFGGMGLTGAILSARLQLRRVDSAWVRTDYAAASDLDSALHLLASSDDRYRYSVAWIDCLATGKSLGRSVLMQANEAPADEVQAETAVDDVLEIPRRRRLSIPFDAPSGLLNRATVGAFNAAYWTRHKDRAPRLVDFDSYFYPLDSLNQWNRLYGGRGFVQYQAVIPTEQSDSGLRELMSRVSESGHAAFLAVLKRFGKENPAPLSFPMEGYTLAMDFPNRKGLGLLLAGLNSIVLRQGGRVYLAKDTALTRNDFWAMYPRSADFMAVRRALDPRGRFSSSLGRRLGLADAG